MDSQIAVVSRTSNVAPTCTATADATEPKSLAQVVCSQAALLHALRDAGADVGGDLSHIKSPFRQDENGSVSVYQDDAGRWFWKDHGADEHGDVADVVALTRNLDRAAAEAEAVRLYSALASEPPTSTETGRQRTTYPTCDEAVKAVTALLSRRVTPTATSTYQYIDADGAPVMVVVRVDHAGGKEVRPVCKSDDGWVIGALPPPRPLFKLARLAAEPAAPVLVVEGERKAVESQAYLSRIVTTSSGGSKAASKTDWSPLAGRDVVIWPDNDGPGAAYAQDVATRVLALDPPAHVRLVSVPERIKNIAGGDVADFIKGLRAEGASDDQIKVELHEALDAAQVVQSALEEEADLAEVFLKKWGKVRPRHYRETWFEFDGTAYVPVPDAVMEGRVMDFLRENSTGIITRSRRDNLIANLATPSLCLIHPGSTVPCLLNGQAHQPAKPAPGGVAFRNGILNVESMVEEQPAGAFAPTSPEIFITNPRPYEFNPSAECPKFLTFLEEVLPDPDVRGLVQEAAGLLQVVDTRFEVFFLFVGEGGNGKSTFLRVLRKVLGDSNVSDIPLRSFSDKFRLISLTRSLANIVTESIERFGQHRVVEDVLKAVVSGEEITVEEKFKGAYSAPATARIVVAANELPLITDRTQGVWRRAVIVPFDITIPEDHQNRNLAKEIIEAEVPGVFNWALQGYLRLRCRGRFDAPAACREAVRRHRLRCAPERQFFQLHVKPGSDSDFASVSQIYAAYQTFARANGYQGAMNVGSFSIALQREFKSATKTMRRVDGTNTRGYAGVVFEPNGVEDVEDAG